MSECCWLLICCPPAERRAKAVALYTQMGFESAKAGELADYLLKIVDAVLAVSPQQIVKMAHKHDKGEA